jgi:hypothetical protein
LTGDPALGLKIYPRKDFEGIWNGIAFLIHDHGGAPPVFNRAGEWRPFAYAPVEGAVDRASLAAFTSDLPTLHQLTPVYNPAQPNF